MKLSNEPSNVCEGNVDLLSDSIDDGIPNAFTCIVLTQIKVQTYKDIGQSTNFSIWTECHNTELMIMTIIGQGSFADLQPYLPLREPFWQVRVSLDFESRKPSLSLIG